MLQNEGEKDNAHDPKNTSLFTIWNGAGIRQHKERKNEEGTTGELVGYNVPTPA